MPYPNGFRGRQGIRFRKIVGSAAQIFENLVGREVEVMLLRSVAARKGGGRA